MSYIEIFRTNVHTRRDSRRLLRALAAAFPTCRFAFDLGDCDRILKMESSNQAVDNQLVIHFFKQQHFLCEVLPD